MSYSSSLTDINHPLVLDTSVLINLHASRYGERILTAVPNEIVVPEIVAGELEHATSLRNGENLFLQNLLAQQVVVLAPLTDSEYETFQEFTSASASLGDGEAATIAIASTRNFLPVIDEKRGRTRFCSFVQEQTPGWSLDLFLHPKAVDQLGRHNTAEAVYLALRDGRMRIPLEGTDNVITLIGEDLAFECTCLPGYRERFHGAPRIIREIESTNLDDQVISN